jgi:hypothetical protein
VYEKTNWGRCDNSGVRRGSRRVVAKCLDLEASRVLNEIPFKVVETGKEGNNITQTNTKVYSVLLLRLRKTYRSLV